MGDDLIGQLLDVAARRLAAYGYLLTGSQGAGEELVQDAIVKVIVRHRRLTSVPTLEGHVHAAMRTIHLDEARRQSSWRAALPRLAQRTSRRQFADEPAEPGPRDPTGRAMATLSPMERAAVVLRHVDHLQIPEMAVAMRVAEAPVETLLSQARAKLSRVLGDIEPEFDQILIVDRTRR